MKIRQLFEHVLGEAKRPHGSLEVSLRQSLVHISFYGSERNMNSLSFCFSSLKHIIGEMEPVCTCNERSRINRRTILATTIEGKDNRPNGSAISSLLNYSSGRSRSCFLIKETKRPKRNCSSDSAIKSKENEDGGLLLSEKFVRTSDSAATEKQKCSSKVCETALSEVETSSRLRKHVSTTGSCNNSASSSSGELWDEEILLRHIKECRCTCNHMGYGNYLDWSEVSTGACTFLYLFHELQLLHI
jgi:hypothetical protein